MSDRKPSGMVPKHESERRFARLFFNHSDWIYEPWKFNLYSTTYTPDFLDLRRNVYIEVVGSRQAYYQNKTKYSLFREIFPHLCLEIRSSDGSFYGEDGDPAYVKRPGTPFYCDREGLKQAILRQDHSGVNPHKIWEMILKNITTAEHANQ